MPKRGRKAKQRARKRGSGDASFEQDVEEAEETEEYAPLADVMGASVVEHHSDSSAGHILQRVCSYGSAHTGPLSLEEMEHRSQEAELCDLGTDVYSGRLQFFTEFQAAQRPKTEADPQSGEKARAMGFHWVLFKPTDGRQERGLKQIVYDACKIMRQPGSVKFTLKPRLEGKCDLIDQLWRV
jgi:hypothetical protein